MQMTMTAPNFSLFAAFGLRLGDNTSRPASAQADRERVAHGRVIDVTAQRVDKKIEPAERAVSANVSTPGQQKPQIATYARPARPGEAPRLQFATAERGQAIDTWA